ncbi:hypothetical protein ACJMK2_011455 [Sinanodonta woodiana]|uniref:Transmembrane protein n=1 Tax=Sinanodonta woodiana TaxID=1069815 RepID=A0ABD3V880_SINWO
MGSGKDIKEGCSLCGTATFCCCCLLIAVALMTLGIAKIVMGAIHLHDCDIERMIPIFLIVSGCTPVLFGCLAKQGNEENREKITFGQIIGSFGLLFSIAWLIAGSVWVFPNWRKLHDNPCKPDVTSCITCNTDLLTFAAAVTIIDWVFMGLFLVSFFCICIRACCKT